MLNASVRGNYAGDTNGAAGTFTVNAGDVKLRAAVTEATFAAGPKFSGLCLSLEKPGSFIIDYDVPRKDVRFQFMNSVRVLDRDLRLTYSHAKGDNRVALDGMLVIDPANKVSANYAFDSGNCKLKYSYTHKGVRTFEPCYDVKKNSWDFAVSQRIYGDDVVRASYQTSSRVLALEWTRASPFNGQFKVAASLNLAEETKIPKLSAESTWNFDM